MLFSGAENAMFPILSDAVHVNRHTTAATPVAPRAAPCASKHVAGLCCEGLPSPAGQCQADDRRPCWAATLPQACPLLTRSSHLGAALSLPQS